MCKLPFDSCWEQWITAGKIEQIVERLQFAETKNQPTQEMHDRRRFHLESGLSSSQGEQSVHNWIGHWQRNQAHTHKRKWKKILCWLVSSQKRKIEHHEFSVKCGKDSSWKQWIRISRSRVWKIAIWRESQS